VIIKHSFKYKVMQQCGTGCEIFCVIYLPHYVMITYVLLHGIVPTATETFHQHDIVTNTNCIITSTKCDLKFSAAEKIFISARLNIITHLHVTVSLYRKHDWK